jgi:hypothetical protein
MLLNDPSGADVRLLDSMGAGQNHDDREAYLRVLAGREPATSFLELRHRVGPETLTARFFAVNDFARIVAAIQRRSTLADVYIGCAPRCRRSGTRRDVARVWVLWAECDGAAAAHAAQHYDPNRRSWWGRDRETTSTPTGRCANRCHRRRPSGPTSASRTPSAPIVRASTSHEFSGLRARGTTSTNRRRPSELYGSTPEPGSTHTACSEMRRRSTTYASSVDGTTAMGATPGGIPCSRSSRRYVSELLGVQARPGRKVRCPFHRDERPSLHVYPTAERGWCCFSCGRGGSIYDLAAALWSVPPRGREFIELKQLLAERFADEVRRPVRAVARELP